MCGIVGVFPIKTTGCLVSSEEQKSLALWFHNELLAHTIKRGKDATGLVATFGEHKDGAGGNAPYFWACLKQPVDADEFLLNDGTDKRYSGQKKEANVSFLMGRLPKVQRPLLHIIGHARARTTGSELNPDNNHPIIIQNTIGVHNGGVKNYKKIYETHKFKATGEVDSEAIMQLFNEAAPDREFTIEDVKYVCERLEGARAVLAFNSKHPHKIAIFRDGERPLEVSVLNELGLLLVYSEREFIKSVLNSYNRMRLIYGEDKAIKSSVALPAVTDHVGSIFANEGGIIDITKEFNNTSTIKDYLGIIKLPDVKNEYKQSYAAQKQEIKTVTAQTTPYGDPIPKPVLGTTEAELVDMSPYPMSGEPSDEAEAIELKDSDIMDDTSEIVKEVIVEVSVTTDNKEDEEEEDSDDDVEQLRAVAESVYLSKEFKDDKRMVFNRLRGKLSTLLNIPGLSERVAEDAVSFAYPEIFSDGYIHGYYEGETTSEAMTEAAKGEEEDEDVNTQQRLENSLALSEAKLEKAKKHIANLKSFLLVSLLAKDAVVMGKDDEVEFDNDIEDYVIDNKNTFSGLNIAKIRDTFGTKDKFIIRKSVNSKR